MSIFVDKENAPVGFQHQLSSVKARLNNPGLRTIQAKTITSDASRSSSVRKPFGSVNSHDTKKSSSGEGKSLKESFESLKGKVVDGPTDVKPTGGARKKTGLVARPVVLNQNKEHEGKKLLEPKKSDSFDKELKNSKSGEQVPPEIITPTLDHAKMQREPEDMVDPIEHMFFQLPPEQEDDFHDLWPVNERPTAFIKNVMRWGFIPGQMVDHYSSDDGSDVSCSPVDYSLMTDFDRISLTDDEGHLGSSGKQFTFDDLPPLPVLPSFNEMVEDFDLEYFSRLG